MLNLLSALTLVSLVGSSVAGPVDGGSVSGGAGLSRRSSQELEDLPMMYARQQPGPSSSSSSSQSETEEQTTATRTAPEKRDGGGHYNPQLGGPVGLVKRDFSSAGVVQQNGESITIDNSFTPGSQGQVSLGNYSLALEQGHQADLLSKLKAVKPSDVLHLKREVQQEDMWHARKRAAADLARRDYKTQDLSDFTKYGVNGTWSFSKGEALKGFAKKVGTSIFGREDLSDEHRAELHRRGVDEEELGWRHMEQMHLQGRSDLGLHERDLKTIFICSPCMIIAILAGIPTLEFGIGVIILAAIGPLCTFICTVLVTKIRGNDDDDDKKDDSSSSSNGCKSKRALTDLALRKRAISAPEDAPPPAAPQPGPSASSNDVALAERGFLSSIVDGVTGLLGGGGGSSSSSSSSESTPSPTQTSDSSTPTETSDSDSSSSSDDCSQNQKRYEDALFGLDYF